MVRCPVIEVPHTLLDYPYIITGLFIHFYWVIHTLYWVIVECLRHCGEQIAHRIADLMSQFEDSNINKGQRDSGRKIIKPNSRIYRVKKRGGRATKEERKGANFKRVALERQRRELWNRIETGSRGGKTHDQISVGRSFNM